MANWQSKTLNSIASITMGSSPKSAAYNDEGIGLPLIQGNADIKNRLTKPRSFTSEITKECKPGDIIMTVRAPVGAIAKSTVTGCLGRGVCGISATKISQEYLYQYLIFQESNWKKLEQGSTFSAVGSKDIKQLSVAYPKRIEEQQKIAEVLSTVDKKINLIDKKIAETEKLKTGLMQKLFSEGVGVQDSDGNWQPHSEFQDSPFGKIPKCWQKLSLESIASVERGKFSARPRNDPKYFGGEIPFVQTGDVVNAHVYIESYSQTLNELGLTVSKTFPPETVLITIAANIGDVAITKFPLACPDSLVGIQANQDICNASWLFFFMQTQKSELDSRATKSAQKNINLQVLKPLSVFLPPLKEQEFIAEILLTSEQKLALLKQQKAETQQLKKGLMQKLLTGEWRVPLDNPEAA